MHGSYIPGKRPCRLKSRVMFNRPGTLRYLYQCQRKCRLRGVLHHLGAHPGSCYLTLMGVSLQITIQRGTNSWPRESVALRSPHKETHTNNIHCHWLHTVSTYTYTMQYPPLSCGLSLVTAFLCTSYTYLSLWWSLLTPHSRHTETASAEPSLAQSDGTLSGYQTLCTFYTLWLNPIYHQNWKTSVYVCVWFEWVTWLYMKLKGTMHGCALTGHIQ